MDLKRPTKSPNAVDRPKLPPPPELDETLAEAFRPAVIWLLLSFIAIASVIIGVWRYLAPWRRSVGL